MSQVIDIPQVGQVEFPDNMSSTDIETAIKKNYPEIHPPQKPNELPALKETGTLEKLTNVGKGVYGGLKDTALGIGQAASMLDPFQGEQKLKSLQDLRNIDLKSRNQTPMTKLGETIGSSLPALAVPELKGTSFMTKPLAPLTEGALIGSTQYADTPKEKMENILFGSTLGGITTLGMKTKDFVGKKLNDLYKWNVENQANIAKAKDIKSKLNDLEPQAADLVRSFAPKGVDAGDIQDKLAQNIKENFGKLKTTGNEMYQHLSTLISPQSAPIQLIDVQGAIEPIMKLQEKIPPEWGDTGLYKKLSALRSYTIPDYETANELRLTVSEDIDKAMRKGDKLLAKRLITVKNGLDKDIEAWGKDQSPEFQKALQDARKFHQDKIVPIQEHPILSEVVSDKTYDTDALVKTFIKSNAPIKAKALTDQLDSAHQNLLKSHVMNSAFEKASNETGDLNPAVFARVLRQQGSTQGVVFNLAEQKQINGYINLVTVLNRDKKLINMSLADDNKIDAKDVMKGVKSAGQGFWVAAKTITSKQIANLLGSKEGQELLKKASYLDPQKQPQKVRRILDYIEVNLPKLAATVNPNKSYKEVIQEKEAE